MSVLQSVPVYLVIPEEQPSKFIVFEKTRGSENERLRTAVFVFDSIAPTMQDAAELNEEVIKALKNIVVLSEITHAGLVNDYNATDTTKKNYRYKAVFEFVYYQ